MELGSQIKRYRAAEKLSQEELANRVFVSRQTISNWENDKSYPDIKSLVLLSEIFHTSLDQLIKGDLEKMKKEIDTQEYATFKKNGAIFTILLIITMVIPVPLAVVFGWFGFVIFMIVFGVAIYYGLQLERYKKKYDIQTYKEILAFTEGNSLSDIEKAREEGKSPYQKVMFALASASLSLIVSLVIILLIKLF